jgi:hypothetical protein
VTAQTLRLGRDDHLASRAWTRRTPGAVPGSTRLDSPDSHLLWIGAIEGGRRCRSSVVNELRGLAGLG